MNNITKKTLMVLFALISTFSLKAQVDDTLVFDANINKDAYILGTVKIGNYNWALNQAMQPNPADVNDMRFETNSIRMKRVNGDDGYMEMTEDKPYGLGGISFFAARSNFSDDRTGIAPVIEVQYSINGGTNWISAGSPVDLDEVDALTQFSFSNINVSGNIRIRLVVTGGDYNKHFNIDSLTFTGYSVACGVPTSLTTVNNTDGSIDVSWNAPVPAPADGYRLAVFKDGTLASAAGYFNIPTTETTFSTDTLLDGTSLMDNTNYLVYILSACDISTVNFSDTVVKAVMVTIVPCDVPTNLTVVDNGNGSITSSWNAPANIPADGYHVAVVDAGSTPIPSDFFIVPSSATAFTTDTLTNGSGLANSSSYDVYIYSSCNTAKAYHSDTINNSVTMAACAMPSDLVVTNNGDGSITATWTGVTPIPTNGYKLAIHSDGSTPDDYDYFLIDGNTTTFTTDTLTNGATLAGGLDYVVTMNTICGPTDVSDSLNDTLKIILPTTCLSPLNLTAVSNIDGSITITWDVPANVPADGYMIAMATEDLNTDSTYFAIDGNEITFTTDTLPDGSSINPYENYFVYIASRCGTDITPVDSVSVYISMQCAVVANMTTTADASGTISVTWDAPGLLPAKGYEVALVEEGTIPTSSDYFDVGSTETSFSSDTLRDGNPITLGDTYVVYLFTKCSNTQISDTLIDTIQTSAAQCIDPINLTVTNNQDGSIDISWTSASQPDNGYYYAIMPAGTSPSFPGDYVATSAETVTNATSTTGSPSGAFEAGETYTVSVLASCDQVNSGNVTKDFTMALSVNSVNSEITGLYPNPTSSTLTIEMSVMNGSISIIDLTGKVVYTNELTSNNSKINVEELPAGIYQVKISTVTGTSFGKFVKE